MNAPDYTSFLKSKVRMAESFGFEIDDSEINPLLKPFQKATVRWAVVGGRRAIFKRFGLGKTFDQIEVVRIVRERAGGMGLIVIPLGVRVEFMRDANTLATGDSPVITDEQRAQLRAWLVDHPERAPRLKFVRSIEECDDPEGLYLTNYETVRDGKLDPRHFTVSSLDEADCLRGFGGTKTFREFMALFAGDDRRDMSNRIVTEGVRYRFVATATPSPNEYIELLAYCAYLGIMDVGQAKTRFFKRNSEKADQLTIHPHKEREFWLWMASWALFVERPSDLDPSFSDEGYDLPALDVRWHEIPADHSDAGTDIGGQLRMFKQQAIGIVDAAREKRDSLGVRVAKMLQIRAEDPDAHRIVWHDLEAERHAIEQAIPGITTVYGSQELDEREASIIQFSDGEIAELAGKPVMLGSGCNFQRHCHWEIFLGIGHKFKDILQAIHRVHRFLQRHPVRIDFIYTEAERAIRHNIERKWQQDTELRKKMTEIIREFGLSRAAMASVLTRSLGVERVEVSGRDYVIANNDCVDETRRMESDSVGLILTSIPFSTQYEYSPNYADFGHTDSNEHFFEQMGYLTPELFRVLAPGRLAGIHVKDRIVPGGMTGLGFQTVYPFHCKTIEHFMKHGFAYMGMKTIVTDVVRENNQTYRLGWTEQCKDATKMSVGMPEYLLIFRKPPTDRTNSYADTPVQKLKPFSLDADGNMIPFDRELPTAVGTGYSRARWQIDAHGFTRSSGQRLLTPEELLALPHDVIFKLFKQHSLENIFDFEHDVRIGEVLSAAGKLPSNFMLLQPQSWSEEVWTDVTRMLTLNGAQSAKGKEMHLCPMQFDIADRAIAQWSMPGEEIYDPFGGLMTVPFRAVKLGRRGRAAELNPAYFFDGAAYCKMAEQERSTPSLFDAFEVAA
ncbi:DNA methylase N-4 [Paraburkholderia tagetis]|uniref:DNA methylase N-4 n=1 Tax=Paraburkholderia tagetis TaxID=2913261 RepID=A0A9X1UK48_9BURK|nr:DNA methylase N-4 [Paraburkholderia tagetis]MCG5072251.1 DNA methylase N-4 [Paraburkholderia tagetis]